MAVRPRMKVKDDLDVLHPLLMKHGKLECIRPDNGPDLITTYLQRRLKKIGIQRRNSV